MKYTTLGNSDLKVSRICLGCMGFGEAVEGMHSWTLPEDESRKIIKQALDLGINFFDTAAAYQGGTSEQFLGRALKDFASRKDVVVATKFTPRTMEEKAAGLNGKDVVLKRLDESLKNLEMDYVDLYILHMWDYGTPIEEILAGFNEAVKQGKVKYIGISNCYSYQLAKANAIAKQMGYPEFVSVQSHYNLLFREEEREMVKLCQEDNIAMTPYSALASGRLAKKPGETSKRLKEDNYAKGKYDKTKDMDDQIIQRVIELANKHQCEMTQISLAWLLTKVTSPVVGATKPHHLEGAVKSVEIELTKEEITYLEELYQPHELVGVMSQNK